MENILYIIISSAAVSGLVTLVTGHYFEHRRFLLEKKLDLYMLYLEKTDYLFSREVFDHEMGMEETFSRMAAASGDLHQLSWKVKLLTRSNKVKELTHAIAYEYDKLCDKDFAFEVVKANDREKALSVIDKINELTDDFLEESGKEIKSWF